MEDLTLKELFPEMADERRDRLGFELRCHGLTRTGEKVEEDGFLVNRYQAQDHEFITKFAIKLFGNG